MLKESASSAWYASRASMDFPPRCSRLLAICTQPETRARGGRCIVEVSERASQSYWSSLGTRTTAAVPGQWRLSETE